jgi:hypothetical protein
MSDEPKKDEQAPEVKTEVSGESLPESELEQVAGGGKIAVGVGVNLSGNTQQPQYPPVAKLV